jgi:hypothetical protein
MVEKMCQSASEFFYLKTCYWQNPKKQLPKCVEFYNKLENVHKYMSKTLILEYHIDWIAPR